LALDATAVTISLLATAVRAVQNSSAEVGAPMLATTSEEDVQLVTELAKTTVTIAAAAVAAVKFAAAMAKATATVATMAIAGPTTKLLGAAGAIAFASDAQEGPAGGERSSQARMEQTLADVPLFALAAVEAALQAAGFQPLNAGGDGKYVGAVAASRTAMVLDLATDRGRARERALTHRHPSRDSLGRTSREQWLRTDRV
jgi:hypothetical protein